MIDDLLPAGAIGVEAWRDVSDVQLFPEEERALGEAVDKRRREFTTARACARAALAALGYEALPIPSGERGEPLWPKRVVGSITHCEGYRACAVAHASEIATLGIDAEPNAPLPERLLGDIARTEELPALRELRRARPDVHWDRLLFSAKESVYKAWFPLARRWLGFEEAVVSFDPRLGEFDVRLLAAGLLVGGRPVCRLQGRWTAHDGVLATAIAVVV